MNSYFYPTESGWFPELLEAWKGTGKSKLAFPFYDFEVQTLPQQLDSDFWMYLYYTKNRTEEITLRGTIPYRVHVVRHGIEKFNDQDAHVRNDWEENARTWFLCDVVEEIRRLDGSYLLAEDFDHTEDKELLSAIRKSVSPTRRISPFVVVGRCMRELHD